MNSDKTAQREGAKVQRRQVDFQRQLVCGLLVLAMLILAACGGGPETPTAIPASVVRPEQPTPVYGQATTFNLAPTVAATVESNGVVDEAPVVAPSSAAQPAPTMSEQTTRSIVLPMLQTPSALGIATGGATLLEQPNGRALVSLPAGAVVTVTGKSADGRYLAAYTNEGVAGWVPAGQLLLFGGDDLIIVDAAAGPGPIATLIAEAMQPVVIATSTPELALAEDAASDENIVVGTVISDGRLNVRSAPDANAAVVAKLNNGGQVQIIAQPAANEWLQVRLTTGVEGWVFAAYIQVNSTPEQ